MAPDFLVIAANELRGIIRQKRVVITVTLVPLLLLPLFLLGMGSFFYISEKKLQERVFNVAVENGTYAQEFVMYIERSENFTIINSSDPVEDISAERLELYLRFSENFTYNIEDYLTGGLNVSYSSAIPASARAKDTFIELVWEFIQDKRGRRLDSKDIFLFSLSGEYGRFLKNGSLNGTLGNMLQDRDILLTDDATVSWVSTGWWEIADVLHTYRISNTGGEMNFFRTLDDDILKVVDHKYVDTATTEEKSGSILGMILPYFVVIYLMSGAMSIGLDAVAGEKERNTLGTLLVNKVSRTSIVVGKIISVMVVSFVSAIFTIGGLGIILAVGLIFGGGGSSSAFAVFTPWVIMGLFLILIPLSTVLVSIIILVGTFARNLKEASTYMTPVFFIVIFLGIMTMSINFDISKRVYFIPIASSVFAMKDLLLGKLTVSLLLLNIFVTVLAASILIYLCVKMFKSEKILFRV